MNTLILNANDLVGVLNDRRMAIANLSRTPPWSPSNSRPGRRQREAAGPTLDKVNDVTAMLEKNKGNHREGTARFVKFQTPGETVSGGFYYNAFIPNITLPQIMQPFLDYAFGFRRGVDAGQPPDNAGPR